MILADTSIWVDFLRRGEPALAGLLERGEVLVHEMVVGELVLGGLPRDGEIPSLFESLPRAGAVTHGELVAFVHEHGLAGAGVGYVDAHLLAATALEPGARLWTRDEKLAKLAERLGLA
ncbi:MAG: type II toxin-antitoxin system VapC family toxin [Polyangia bacterium]